MCHKTKLNLYVTEANTSLNKSRAWRIDSATNKKKNPYDFYKVLTFKWYKSKFEHNWIISLQITII